MKPSPVHSAINQANRSAINPEQPRDLRLRHCQPKTTYFPHFRFGQFCMALPRSSSAGTVTKFVCLILLSRGPSQMMWIHASKMTIATFVRRLVLRRRGWSIDCLANQTVDRARVSFVPYQPVTCRQAIVGPSQASPCRTAKNYRLKETLRIANAGAALRWIAVTPQSSVMPMAEATAGNRLAASVNRTYTGRSHSSLRQGSCGQDPPQRGQTLGGSAICTTGRAGVKA